MFHLDSFSMTGLQHSVKSFVETKIYSISCMCSLQTAKPQRAGQGPVQPAVGDPASAGGLD